MAPTPCLMMNIYYNRPCNGFFSAGIAQLVEQRTENPRVTSSSLVPGILILNDAYIIPSSRRSEQK